MRRSLARFSELESSLQARSWADFITNTCGFRFSVHTAARQTAPLAAALRRLEQLKNRADAELVAAERALAAATMDQAKERAETRRQKAAARAAELATQLDTARADAKSKLDAAVAARDAGRVGRGGELLF